MQKTKQTQRAFMTALLAITVVFTFFTSHAHAQKKALGAMKPADALVYMQQTKNLYILDVSPVDKHQALRFEGSVNIPMAELIARINELPADRPVIVHCRLGRTCVKAYPIILRMRPEIPEVSFIDGEPPINAYNAWLKTQK